MTKMQVILLPALSDNYIFLLHDPEQNLAAVVDPAEAKPVLKQLKALNAKLVSIFNTHHHQDHVGGNSELLQHYPQAQVYAGAHDQGRIPGQQIFLQEGDKVEFAGRKASVLFVPGHTKAHIAYYFPPVTPDDTGELFCGDTLFAGGCGRLFEGTPTQMVESLSKLKALPDNTRVWCAHEYTQKNLQFALRVDGDNQELKNRYAQVQDARRRKEPTVPSQLGLEKLTNPFLRWQEPALQTAVKAQSPIQAFARLRGMKDQF
jgi:hydroxyacylglutathione hydrolase